MSTGFQLGEIVKKDFVLGASNQLGGAPLTNGNWEQYLPLTEVQNKGTETFSCVSFATLNCVEILERQEFGYKDNWSDRFLAYATGTEAMKGNTPKRVAEFLRKKGTVKEIDWAFDNDFYKIPPQNLYTLALQFPAEYNFGYEYVPSNAEAMMEALKYSPLLASAYAWVKDENGLHYRPQGMDDNHAMVIYGYVEGQYWLVFDSYLDDGLIVKKLRWDSIPMQMMRFTLHRQVVNESFFQLFLKWMRQIFDSQSLGAKRSPHWSTVRSKHVEEYPECAFGHNASLLNPLAVHHIKDFSTSPLEELNPDNLISLCRLHHLYHGHLGSWRSINLNIRGEVAEHITDVKNRR